MDRRFPIVPFDFARFAPFFGGRADSLEAELFSGGACNSNYLVRCGGNKFVCRIYSRGDPVREEMILGRIAGLVPTPEYLWVGEGVAVMSFIDGAHFVPTGPLMREAGRMIARLSTITFERGGEILEDGNVRPFEGWSSLHSGLGSLLRRSDVREYVSPDLFEKIGTVIDENKAILNDFDKARNLVHGDFRPDNLLVSGDAIVGILDWEFSHSGSSYMDVGNLLRHFPPHWEDDLALGLRDEGFALPDDWRFRSRLIDLASHLEFLTSRRSPDFKHECVERIEELVAIHDARGRALGGSDRS